MECIDLHKSTVPPPAYMENYDDQSTPIARTNERRLDVAKVIIEFHDGTTMVVDNGDYSKLMMYRAQENSTRIGQPGPVNRWVEMELRWSVPMVMTEEGWRVGSRQQ